MHQTTSREFSTKERELKDEVLKTIREIIGEDKIHIGDTNFVDEANNPIFAINKDDVFLMKMVLIVIHCMN